MKKLYCPQCGIQRFFVKNAAGESRLVNVLANYEVVPVKEEESLQGFDLAVIYCLGCSWQGSPKVLAAKMR